MSSTDKKIYTDWEKVLGADYISILPEAGRVVDVIFGILAKETGREEYFEDELTERQTVAQKKTVMKALKTIHSPSKTHKTKRAGKSIMKKSAAGMKSKSLI
jgi:hypothetical protein